MHARTRTGLSTASLAAVTTLALAGCAGAANAPAASVPSAPEVAPSTTRVALTYDGGLLVLDGESLETVADLPADGFLRVSTAGDESGHVFVTMDAGFQVLDTGLSGSEPALTDVVFPADAAGHAVPHEGRTALFADGTGEITLFDTEDVNGASLPEVETVPSEAAHHGVALELSDGTLLATIGTEESRSGVRLLDTDRAEIARSEECPSVHGEGSVEGEAVVFGCEDGVLVFRDGDFVKLDSPDEYGRVGNAYVTDESAIAVVDYKSDPDMEGYLLSSLGFVDTEAETFEVVALPDGVGYTWRGVGRDTHGDVVVLGSDGALHKLDLNGTVQESWPLIEAWESPAQWQDPHPALKVVGDIAYVTEPATNTVYAVDLHSGEVLAEASVDQTPNEIAVVGATTAH